MQFRMRGQHAPRSSCGYCQETVIFGVLSRTTNEQGAPLYSTVNCQYFHSPDNALTVPPLLILRQQVFLPLTDLRWHHHTGVHGRFGRFGVFFLTASHFLPQLWRYYGLYTYTIDPPDTKVSPPMQVCLGSALERDPEYPQKEPLFGVQLYK